MTPIETVNIAGLVLNLLAIVGVAAKLERRITTLEVHLKYALAGQYRRRDDVPDEVS